MQLITIPALCIWRTQASCCHAVAVYLWGSVINLFAPLLIISLITSNPSVLHEPNESTTAAQNSMLVPIKHNQHVSHVLHSGLMHCIQNFCTSSEGGKL